MPLDRKAVQDRLKNFDFSGLFTQELGWDWHTANLSVTVDGTQFNLEAIAHKRGMVAYHCAAPGGARIPEYAVRRKIEQQATKTAREHLIIFTDAAQTTQIWQWVKREPGKPAACRERTYHKGHSGEALIQRLQEIAFTLEEEEKLTLPDVASRARKGFDVERVTKRFYDQFQKEHAKFLSFIDGITEGTDREWYASVMLNRLMFVYFIQRKGFLDGDEHYLRNRLARCQQEKGTDKFYSFYRYFLVRLFHEGFGKRPKDRAPDLEKLVGRIPYLNGGFFEQHQIEQHYKDIEIPDKAFERIFDYFDQYQWHLDERPLRADNEINPDVLGFIFEKYINQKQMGAYYTQEDITGYICRTTIIPFLFDAARKEHKAAFEGDNAVWKLLQTDPDRYIYPALRHGITLNFHTAPYTPLSAPFPLPEQIEQGIDAAKPNLAERREGWNKPALPEYALPTETWREVVSRRQRYEELRSKLAAGQVREINDLITLNLDIVQFAQDVIRNCDTPELLRAFWKPLEKISVLDPTVGSGAFLFAALNILKPLYEACLERMDAFVGDLDRSPDKHRPEKFKHFREVLDRVEAHPNTDYFILKSIILSNLYGVDIMEEATEICKLRLFLKLAAQVQPDVAKDNFGIEPLPDIDFNIRAGNTLVGYANPEEVRRCMTQFGGGQMKLLSGDELASYERFLDHLQIADAAWRTFRQQQIELGGTVTAKDKADLRAKFSALESELNRYLATDYHIDLNNKTAYSRWIKYHSPFHWLVEFYGIIVGGGFDVIIGNPPYVEYRNVRGTYKLPPKRYDSEEGENLYVFCMERSCQLLRLGGTFGMIVPTSVVGLDETACLRTVMLKRFDTHWCSTYGIRPSKLFDGVDQRLCIYIASGSGKNRRTIWTTRFQHWYSEERPTLFSKISYTASFYHEALKRIPQLGSKEAGSVLGKIEQRRNRTVSFYYSTGRTGLLMHYHRSPRYWIRAMDFEQYFKSPTRSRSVHHFRDLHFRDNEVGKFIGALLNSSLFFFWFFSLGNGRNITGTDVEQFPVGEIELDALKPMTKVFDRLMRDYDKNSFIRERQDCEFQEFRPSLSKPVIDEIDRILSDHFGFTEEELDFIVNYEIKYRLGRDSEDGDD